MSEQQRDRQHKHQVGEHGKGRSLDEPGRSGARDGCRDGGARFLAQPLRDPVQTSEGVLTVAASLGVALADPDSDASDPMRRADRAMYRVKLSQR